MPISPTPVVLSWSGGKDSALALLRLLDNPQATPVRLVSTFTEGVDRISMHGVRRELIQRQADAVALPLDEVWIPRESDNETYEKAVGEYLFDAKNLGVDAIAFGDLYLADIRKYRERLVAKSPLSCVFPLWLEDTSLLATEFIARGFQAKTCCIDTASLDDAFCGREMDQSFFDELPKGVDPCGENGEYHSFVYNAPYFRSTIEICSGATHRSDRFLFREFELFSTSH